MSTILLYYVYYIIIKVRILDFQIKYLSEYCYKIILLTLIINMPY